MGSIALVFPGQGAQYAGMGRELYEYSPAARVVLDGAETIRPGTLEQCFNGSAEELARTENTQPCVYCVGLAAAEALKEAGVEASMLAGFSLGELAALTFSKAVSCEDGFRLVCKRAELMNTASETVTAWMAAVLTLSDDEVVTLCAGFDGVYPVNFNCSGQVVVAGLQPELEPFLARVKAAGGRAIRLKVSGGFHSPYMSGASEEFAKALETFEILSPQLPLYSNVTAELYEGDVKTLLVRQICNPVLWRREIENMIAAGADTFVEVGPGKTLCGLVSRISDKVSVFNVEDKASLEKAVLGLRELQDMQDNS